MKFFYSILFVIFTGLTIDTTNAQILATASSEDDATPYVFAKKPSQVGLTNVYFFSGAAAQWDFNGGIYLNKGNYYDGTCKSGLVNSFIPTIGVGQMVLVMICDKNWKTISKKAYNYHSTTPDVFTFPDGGYVCVIFREIGLNENRRFEP